MRDLIARGGRIALTVVAAIAVLFFGTAPAVAAAPADELTWSVRAASGDGGGVRGEMQLHAEPGAEVSDAVVISNYSAVELTLSVYAADAYSAEDGSPVAGPPGPADEASAASWVSVSESAVLVPAGSAVTVPYTVRVPPNAEPGDHTFAVLTSWLDESADVAVDRRLGIRGFLRVGGDTAPSLAISDLRLDVENPLDPFSARAATLTFTLSNSGNIRLVPASSFMLTDLFGRPLGGEVAPTTGSDGTVFRSAGDLPALGPGESVRVHIDVSGVAAPVALVAADLTVTSMAVTTGSPAPADLRTSVTALSVPWIVVILLGLVVIAAVAVPLVRRRAQRSFDERVAAEVERSRVGSAEREAAQLSVPQA